MQNGRTGFPFLNRPFWLFSTMLTRYMDSEILLARLAPQEIDEIFSSILVKVVFSTTIKEVISLIL
jgi:hypothetical protein